MSPLTLYSGGTIELGPTLKYGMALSPLLISLFCSASSTLSMVRSHTELVGFESSCLIVVAPADAPPPPPDDDWLLPPRCRSSCTASRFIPHVKHFWYLQYWHRFRCRLSIIQFFSSRHAYVRSLRTVRLKNPLHPSQLYTP